MTSLSPKELAQKIGAGLLSFPVTAFDAELEFDETRHREHVSYLNGYDVTGLFVAGWETGEYFSLSNDEISQVVRSAVMKLTETFPCCRQQVALWLTLLLKHKLLKKPVAAGIRLFPPYLTENHRRTAWRHTSERFVSPHPWRGGVQPREHAVRSLDGCPPCR